MSSRSGPASSTARHCLLAWLARPPAAALVLGLAVVWLVAALVGAAPASADHACAGVSVPDTVTVDGTSLALNGQGIRKVKAFGFTVQVYVAALYLERPSDDAAPLLAAPQRWRMQLRFVRDVQREQITEAFDAAFDRIGIDDPVLQADLTRLNGWMSDMADGGTLTFTAVPGTGVRADVDGVDRGTIEHDAFAPAFLAIWLGPHPANPELKTGLLGGTCG